MRLPSSETYKISRNAMQWLQLLAPKKTGRGLSQLSPVSEEGMVGINVPNRVSYMLSEDEGTPAYNMNSLAGKNIPIRGADGNIVFRRAQPSAIGQQKIISRKNNGELITEKIQWQHPAEKPRQFIEKSIDLAFREWKRQLTTKSVIAILRQTEAKDAMRELFGR